MLIKCLLKREGGTHIDLYGKKYHFKPNPKDTSETPDHVCEVEDAAAVHRLLSIKEGYAAVNPEEALPEKPKAPAQTVKTDGGTPDKPADKPIIVSDGKTEYNLSDMELEPLQTLARDVFNIRVHHKWKEPTIIAKIIEATRTED